MVPYGIVTKGNLSREKALGATLHKTLAEASMGQKEYLRSGRVWARS